MRKILFVTDSLGLPRELPDKVIYEKTYLNILRHYFKQKIPDLEIISISIGGGSIEDLSRQLLGYYKATDPDLVIIQSGIVDCSPRMFKKSELARVQIGPRTRKVVFKLNQNFKVKIRKHRKITYTPPKEFEKVSKRLKEIFDDRIYWLGILPTSQDYELIVPGISKNVTFYNNLIKKNYQNQFIDLSTFPFQGISKDHHHLNEHGHQLIAAHLKALLLSKLK